MELTKEQARRFMLAHQGLWTPYEFQGKPGVLAYLRRVGCIQYDPLNIVGHNSDLVLQARVAGFRPGMLREMLYEDRTLLDGWDKMMSIYLTGDWPYFRRWRDYARNGTSRGAEAVRAVLPQVRAEIEARGPLSSLDLEMSEIIDWDWSQSRLARAALESMYFWGELIVHHKVHTRKFYDFAHHYLPEDLLRAADPNETDEAYQDWHVHRRIGSVGLLWGRSGEAWLMSSIKSKERRAALQRLMDRGEILEARIEGIAEAFYLRGQDRPVLERVLAEGDPQPQASVMAPLDNLLWDRRMLEELFDFEYRWEVYVPAGKRRYGYYVLPVLYGDRFIARFDPEYDKKQGVLTINNWWWEDGVSPSEPMKSELVQCFERFLAYLGAERLKVDREIQGRPDIKWLVDAFS